MTEAPSARAARAFAKVAGAPPTGVAFAPGRVNLIGEHVDHQGGPVLPMAIPEGVHVAWASAPAREIRVVALDTGASDRFASGDTRRTGDASLDLARGTAAALSAAGVPVRGATLVSASDLPMGAGLASSAAYVVAVARAILGASGGPAPAPAALARLAQGVETAVTGVRCGTMDPYVAARGRVGEPLLLDCATLSHEALPAPRDAVVTWHDSGVRRTLAATPYNERRAEIEAGLAAVRKACPDVTRLSDLEPARWRRLEPHVPSPARLRVRHVVTEIARVRAAAQALRTGDTASLARLLDEGHASLAGDFEASRPDLEALRATLRGQPGVLAVRLQGAGWGGCFVVLREAPGGGARGGSRTLNALAGTGS